MKTQLHLQFRNRGFALVVTLAMMILLVVVAVGLLSLSSISLRGSSAGESQAIAKANARMALMLAIGELQKSAGPDQRVTAEAALLEPITSGELLANRHWTGVWRTDRLKEDPASGTANQPLIYRESKDPNATPPGSPAADWDTVIDRRSAGNYVAKDQVMSWLVSNPDATKVLDPSVTLTTGDAVVNLVGPKSAAGSEQVQVMKVPMRDSHGRNAGGYGWWVGDVGVKARFDLEQPTQAPAKDFLALVPSQSGIGSIDGYKAYQALDASQVGKVISAKTSELVIADTDACRNRFHDVGFGSLGVIADSLNGGLKRDLSAILDTGTAAALGDKRVAIDANTPVFNTVSLKNIGPKFGVLKSWSDLANSVTGSNPGAMDPQPASTAVNLARNRSAGGDMNYAAGGVDLKNQNKAGVHPVLLDCGTAFGLSYRKVGTETSGIHAGKDIYRMRLHLSPRVVLWNPYNVKMNSASYAVQMAMPHSTTATIYSGTTQLKTFTFFDQNTQTGIRRYWQGVNAVDNMAHAPVYSLPNVSFEPGEALLFTCPGGVAQEWPAPGSASSLGSFALTATSSLPLNGSFYFNLPDSMTNNPTAEELIEKYSEFHATPAEAANLRYSMGVNTTYRYQQNWYQLGLVRNSAAPIQKIFNNSAALTPLQYFHMTEDGALASDLPGYKPGSNEPKSAQQALVESSDLVNFRPYYRCKWGHRFVFLGDTSENQSVRMSGGGALNGIYNSPFLNYNQLVNHNIRSSWHMRSPCEVVLRVSGGGGRVLMGNMIDDPFGWDWSDPALEPASGGGKNRVSPFTVPGGTGGATYPLYQIPTQNAPVLSIGMLQHVPLSVFQWHPGNAVGNALADPRVPRDKTTSYVSTSQWSYLHSGNENDWPTVRQMSGATDDTLGKQNWLYDLSYEANRALWDGFFLSSIHSQVQIANNKPLPNPRMICFGDASAPAVVSDLRDANKAASKLLIAGAFNVNSTSEQAWRALLNSFRANPSIQLTLNDGQKIDAGAVFSRLVTPVGGEYKNGHADDPAMWTGYRRLSDDQIAVLAKEIVVEVRRRGPFLSLADFVNRRLVKSPTTSGAETEITKTGLKGALQAAIDRSMINESVVGDPNVSPTVTAPDASSNFAVGPYYKIPKVEYDYRERWQGKYGQEWFGTKYPDVAYPTDAATGDPALGSKPDHNQWAESKLTGAPACLMQADLLQKLGPVLSARSDTFTIRAYGEARDAITGKVTARAWAEATVLRTPEPILADGTGLDPDATKAEGAFGRKIIITSFRWLHSNEI